jgi:hypothetical protein
MLPPKLIWMEVRVYMVVTKRGHEDTSTSTVVVVPIGERGSVLHEIPLGDNQALAEALTAARWADLQLRVPATFFARDDATKRTFLQRAVLCAQQESSLAPSDASSA